MGQWEEDLNLSGWFVIVHRTQLKSLLYQDIKYKKTKSPQKAKLSDNTPVNKIMFTRPDQTVTTESNAVPTRRHPTHFQVYYSKQILSNCEHVEPESDHGTEELSVGALVVVVVCNETFITFLEMPNKAVQKQLDVVTNRSSAQLWTVSEIKCVARC